MQLINLVLIAIRLTIFGIYAIVKDVLVATITISKDINETLDLDLNNNVSMTEMIKEYNDDKDNK